MKAKLIEIKGYLWIFFTTLCIAFLSGCAPENETEIVPDYTGTWTCTETSSNPPGTITYGVRIKKVGASDVNYTVENFYNLGYSNAASITISGTNILVASQTIGSGSNSFSVNGSGSVNNSAKLSLSYAVNDGSSAVDNCTAVLVKQ